MEKICKKNKTTHSWLMEEPIEHWVRFMFDQELKVPDNATNFMENFNGRLRGSDINHHGTF